MSEQTWDFRHQEFHSYCTCQRIILPLSPTPDPGAEKIPHISQNLLQHVPAVPANNTSIKSGSGQTAPSSAIWVPARHFQTLLPTRPEKFCTISPRLIPSTSVTGLSRGAIADLANVDESTERERNLLPFTTKMDSDGRQSTYANLGIIQMHKH